MGQAVIHRKMIGHISWHCHIYLPGQLAQTQLENSWIITAINNADVTVDDIEMPGMLLSPDYWCHPTCDWHCRASRSAGTPHHWSHCFHRNPLRQQNCEKGENQIKLINKPQFIAEGKCCIKSSVAKWAFPTAAASPYMHLTGKAWVDSYYEVVAGNVLCLSVRVARKNVSARQDNGYFCHFLTAGQFEILQGLMKQEGATLVCRLLYWNDNSLYGCTVNKCTQLLVCCSYLWQNCSMKPHSNHRCRQVNRD